MHSCTYINYTKKTNYIEKSNSPKKYLEFVLSIKKINSNKKAENSGGQIIYPPQYTDNKTKMKKTTTYNRLFFIYSME